MLVRYNPLPAMMGTKLTDKDLFQLAPLVLLKFRERMLTGKKQEKVVKGALANYVANEERGLKASPKLAFALCYVASHLVLDLITEDEAQDFMAYCEEHLE
jgi:hypothetical protein